MKEIKSLQYLNIPYKVIYTKYRRLVIKYDRKGILNIRCPKMVKHEELEEFVSKHIDWIKEHYVTPKDMTKTYDIGDVYLFLGKKYYLNIIESRHTGVYLKDNEIVIYVNNKTDVLKELNKWKVQQAESVFEELLHSAFIVMEKELDKYPKLKIKKYVSRWGCCYPKRNMIILNIALIHTPVHLINYVIYHELAHFKYMNHQKEFHAFLQKYVPDELKCKKELKNYEADYE